MSAEWDQAMLKFSQARGRACYELKYLTARIHQLIVVEAKGLGTLAVTDRMVCLVDPAYVMSASLSDLAGAIVHEQEHPAREHHARLKALGCEPKWGNICADAEINDDIRALHNPHITLTPRAIKAADIDCPDGWMMEEYILKGKRPKDGQGGQNGPPGPPGPGGQGQGQGNAPGGQNGPPGAGLGSKPAPGEGWCGSAAGRPVPGEAEAISASQQQGRSEAEIARVNKQVAREIIEAAQRGRGTVPGGWLRWAEARLKPPVIRWQEKMAKLVRISCAWKAGQVDYSYTKMSRRQAAIGYGAGKPIAAALRAPIPEIVIVVDTSGSMGTKQLNRAIFEINSILKSSGGPVTFMANDADTHGVFRVKSIKDLSKCFKGGGGTDFTPAFNTIAKMKKNKPNVIIFVTDGCGPCNAIAPKGARVIWVLVGPYQQKPTFQHGEFGEFVSVPKEWDE